MKLSYNQLGYNEHLVILPIEFHLPSVRVYTKHSNKQVRTDKNSSFDFKVLSSGSQTDYRRPLLFEVFIFTVLTARQNQGKLQITREKTLFLVEIKPKYRVTCPGSYIGS